MKVKQLIERNLLFSDKYVYLEIVRGSIESGQMCTCDNCGKLITNMVHIVRKSDSKHFSIGTDCAETLIQAKCMYNNGSQSDFQMDIYAFNECARFVTELNAGATLTKLDFQCSLINRKGKEVLIFTHTLLKYFPQYL